MYTEKLLSVPLRDNISFWQTVRSIAFESEWDQTDNRIAKEDGGSHGEHIFLYISNTLQIFNILDTFLEDSWYCTVLFVPESNYESINKEYCS